jgi:hypothetical protein
MLFAFGIEIVSTPLYATTVSPQRYQKQRQNLTCLLISCSLEADTLEPRVDTPTYSGQRISHTVSGSLAASCTLCDSVLVEIQCINVCRNTTVFLNFLRKQLRVTALFWVGHHQVETRILEKTHILLCGHQEWGNEISFYSVWGGV